jgi:predicted nucleic acid-binding protein
MPDLVFDNCVLSNFALSNSLNILTTLYKNASYITDFVSAENTRGILRGYKELMRIREAVRDGRLKEITLRSKADKTLFESLSVSMGFGEASSIAVAKTRGFVFACDDKAARREASLLGVKLTGTIGILIKAVRIKAVDLKEADKILSRMIDYGFYSPVNSIEELL